MIRSGWLRALCAGFLCCSLTPLIACSASPDRGEREERAGTLSLPLSVSVGEHVYRFSYFQVYVYPSGTVLYSSADSSETVLKA